METLRSDSPLSRRIVLAFLDFLNSVEMAPGTDPEAVEVVSDCLQDTFKINLSSPEDRIEPGFLMNLFKLAVKGEDNQSGPALSSGSKEKKPQTYLSSKEIEDCKSAITSDDPGSSGVSHDLGFVSRDELFGRFYTSLDKIGFFNSLPGGIEDPEKTTKAKYFFDEAIAEMESSKVHTMDLSNLAEALKEKGNEAMRLNKYSDAIDLYTCSIAIKENAVYYCNRAAAYTNVGKYVEAIDDCLKSIEIDPNYSKAYSRLGSAYFSLGQYRDALDRGYLRALQIDPNNRTIQENIQVTQQKILEQTRHWESESRRVHQAYESRTQSTGPTNINFTFPMGAGAPTPDFVTNIFRNMTSAHSEASGSQSFGPAPGNMNFSSFPFNGSIPVDFANVIGNMASSAQGRETHEMNTDILHEPEVNVDANVSISFGESPNQVSDVLRTVMGMFPSQNAQGPNESETSGRPE